MYKRKKKRDILSGREFLTNYMVTYYINWVTNFFEIQFNNGVNEFFLK